MFEFISKNASAISAIANVIMVMVWITYLQLLLNGILRQRRSSLIISCSVSTDNTPTCFVSNMSEGRFHIQNIDGTIEIDGEAYGGDITEPIANSHEQSFQRPLADGESLELGTFRDLLDRVVAAQKGNLESDLLQRYGTLDFYITIVGIHGASRKAVAARRAFRLRSEGGNLKASGLLRHTEQYRWGPRRQRIVEKHQVIN
ncbi:MAG: hypothetical protein RIB03_08010 [Henriciella sp.]|uniref:hypothetical protein n=1 Tax=Henriciella sp. TaxID=1968823 RepID=UPI0032ECAB3E